MNIEKINMLYNKDDKLAYSNLLELEEISQKSNEVYEYFSEFLKMLNNEKSFIRVRGFRLICSNARWDNENRIDREIEKILLELDDDKPTAVRQCIQALNKLLPYKIELIECIKSKLKTINYSKYKESMQGLIKKDIDSILEKQFTSFGN